MSAPAPWSVRRARLDDLQALTSLSAANRIYHAQVSPTVGGGDLAGRAHRYRALLEADNTLVLIAETLPGGDEPEGTPIACFAAIFYPAGPGGAARAYVEDVFVVRRWRRRRVLAAMMEQLVVACRSRGITRVDVDYLADNPAGAAAWASVGFAPRSVSATATVDALSARVPTRERS